SLPFRLAPPSGGPTAILAAATSSPNRALLAFKSAQPTTRSGGTLLRFSRPAATSVAVMSNSLISGSGSSGAVGRIKRSQRLRCSEGPPSLNVLAQPVGYDPQHRRIVSEREVAAVHGDTFSRRPRVLATGLPGNDPVPPGVDRRGRHRQWPRP